MKGLKNVKQQYSVIDIETTGSARNNAKITEISIINTDGKEIQEIFTTLINPECHIPSTITHLTGISNEMVIDSPKFYEVAKKVVEMTDGRIFVAHNVQFDYSFFQKEFRELGFVFKRDKLCTVRLCRKVFPGLASYSLKNLTDFFKIKMSRHHRAESDAMACLELLKMCLDKDQDMVVTYQRENSSKMALPPHLNEEDLEDLPETPGVYYFYDQNEVLLYIGKSKNIRKRVKTHFKLNCSKKDLAFRNKIARIEFKETGNELAALLIEASEIKDQRPRFNVALRRKKKVYCLIQNFDDDGYVFYDIRHHQIEGSTFYFSTKRRAQQFIRRIYKKKFGLDLESIQFQKNYDLIKKSLGAEKHNKLIIDEVSRFEFDEKSFEIKLNGRKRTEKCFVQVQAGSIDQIKYIDSEGIEYERLIDDIDTRFILVNYLEKYQPKLLSIS